MYSLPGSGRSWRISLCQAIGSSISLKAVPQAVIASIIAAAFVPFGFDLVIAVPVFSSLVFRKRAKSNAPSCISGGRVIGIALGQVAVIAALVKLL